MGGRPRFGLSGSASLDGRRPGRPGVGLARPGRAGALAGPGRFLLLAALPVLAVLMLRTVPAHAAFDFKDASWQGTSELLALARGKLGKARVRLIATVPWDEIQPADALLVLHPEHDLDYREVAAFLAAGGRLGLLDDYGKGDLLLSRFRIHRVSGPFQPEESLRDNPNLPIAVPAVEGADGRPHPVVAGVDRVVTNHPTGLETDRGLRLTAVLELPSKGEAATALALIGVIGDAKRCGLLAAEEAPIPGTTGDATGNGVVTARCGRLLAMGDPSAVMNLMLRYPGNRAFAASLVDYLVGDDTWGRRGGTLYLVANDFAERGSFGNRGGWLGAVEDRLEALTRLVADARREGLPRPLALILAVLATAATALWALNAATRRYRRAVPRYARPTPLVAQGGLAGRAAVLAADTTHRALAVLELKAALEEALRDGLGLAPTASLDHVREEIDRQDALSRRNSKALGDLLTEMARAEDAVTRTERIRITRTTIRRMHDAMTAILADLEERLGRRP